MSEQLKRRRFTALDFFLVMLAAAALLTIFLRGNLARKLGLEDAGEETQYTLFLSALSPEDALLFHAGEVITHPDTGESLGTIRTVKRENAVVYTIDENGLVRSASDAKSFDLTLIIQGNGKQSERGFLLNGSYFASPGDTISLLLPGKARFSATVICP